MKRSIVTIKTITIGQKCKRALANRGIKSKIVKIDSTNSDRGCQYGLEFNENDFYNVIGILREYGIEYGVYDSK